VLGVSLEGFVLLSNRGREEKEEVFVGCVKKKRKKEAW